MPHISRMFVVLFSLIWAMPLSSARAGQSDMMVGVSVTMHATLFTPDGPGPYPAVLVLHTSGGLRDADLAYAQALAKAGYVALVPAFLNAYGISAAHRQETFTNKAEPIYADLAAAVDMLRQNPLVRGRKIGAVGFSNGGYFAMWLAATGKVAAGVSYYGALSGAGADTSLERFRQVFNHNSSPVLILHGTNDHTVPVGAAKRLGAIITAAGSPFELKLYEGADHEFDRDPGPEVQRNAAADAWVRTSAFLAQNLAR